VRQGKNSSVFQCFFSSHHSNISVRGEGKDMSIVEKELLSVSMKDSMPAVASPFRSDAAQ